MLIFTAATAIEQEQLGAQLARALPGGGVVYLQGELGAGKTTLVRGLLRALGHVGAVKSPTYTLLEPYTVRNHELLHLDLYRLRDPSELEDLGLRDFLDVERIWLVEWPECGAGVLPAPDLVIMIEYQTGGRRLTYTSNTAIGAAVLDILAWPDAV